MTKRQIIELSNSVTIQINIVLNLVAVIVMMVVE